VGVPRLLVLFHDPYHLDEGEARAWLIRELDTVLDRDHLDAARLTRLGTANAQPRGAFDWLLELAVDRDPASPGPAIRDLVADLRMLGMAPMVAFADERNAVEVRRG
jgi:hypothetical protein